MELEQEQHKVRRRRTKMVCTIGPACRSYDKITGLIQAGMDVGRLHFSYSGQAEHEENIRRIRKASSELSRTVAILQDLSGSKVRMKDFKADSVKVEWGKEFILTSRDVPGTSSEVSVNIPELISVIRAGDTVLLADGAVTLKAASVTDTDACCKVLRGGILKSKEAVHVPGKGPPVRVPTVKDREDVLFGIRHEVDWIAQSYATSAEEIYELRDFVRQHGALTPIIAKIERREALNDLDNIIEAADAIMVARGDLGLEIPLEEIAFVQKDIIRRANTALKPVITATEMLGSMMEKPYPARAEVTDISNAILDGTDAVMLSGETAMGKYPIEAATAMARIALAADDHVFNTQASTQMAEDIETDRHAGRW